MDTQKEVILQRNARTADIVRHMKQAARKGATSEEIKRMAAQCNSLEDVFNAAINAASYERDPEGKQLIRTPDRTIKEGVANCVDYTVLISSILLAKGMPHYIRVSKYRNGAYSHVYVKVNNTTIDPVSGTFNKEVPYLAKKDYKMADVYLLQGPTPANFTELQKAVGQIFDTSGSKCDNVYSLAGGSIRKAWRIVDNFISDSVKKDANALDEWIKANNINVGQSPGQVSAHIITLKKPLTDQQVSVLRNMFITEAKSITYAGFLCNKQSRENAALAYIAKKFDNYIPATDRFYQYLVYTNAKAVNAEFRLTVLKQTGALVASALGVDRFLQPPAGQGPTTGTVPPESNKLGANWVPLALAAGGLLLFSVLNNDNKKN